MVGGDTIVYLSVTVTTPVMISQVHAKVSLKIDYHNGWNLHPCTYSYVCTFTGNVETGAHLKSDYYSF